MAQQRFIDLLTKELTEGLSATEKQELEMLLQQNPHYKQQNLIIKEYWNSNKNTYRASATNFEKLMDKIRAAETSSILQHTDNEPVKLWSIIKYLAAALVLGTLLCLWYISANNIKTSTVASNWQNKITAPRQKARIVLTDGTIVTLNSGTSFRYPRSFGGKTREVYLNGEAFFEVHKDRDHPFIIHANKMNVKVLGTAFNIKSYANALRSETSLIHGSIEVTLNDRTADRIILKPHDKLIIENNSSTELNKTNITSPNSNKLIAATKGTQYSLTNLTYNPTIDSAALETLWLKNKLVFNDADFLSIAADMERWYGIKIIFKNEELKKLRFTATFERETPTKALESLRITEAFHFKQKDQIIYISK